MPTDLIRNCLFFLICWRLVESNGVYYPGYWAYPPSFENITRGAVGPPGKRGPPGFPGGVTQCDCAQSNSEFRQVFEEMQRLLNLLESKFFCIHKNKTFSAFSFTIRHTKKL